MRRRASKRGWAAAGVLAAGMLAAPAAAAAPPGAATPAPSPYVERVVTDPRIGESSGLAVSTRDPSILWTHNDSGDTARLFAVGADGATRAVLTLPVQARDWEAMAAGPDHTLWVGDLGDNRASRTRGVLVHRLVEPARLVDATARVTSYRLVYPDGPRDAEALLVDPRDGRVWVATKAIFGGELYRAPLPLDPTTPNRLERVGDVPALVTDGAFLPDGRMVLRTYASAYVYARPGAQPVTVALPAQDQGESIAPAPGGTAVLVGSEGRDSQVWSVPLPSSESVTASPSAGPPGAAPSGPSAAASEDPGQGARATDGQAGWSEWRVGAVLAGAAVAVSTLAAVLGRARGRRTRR